MREIQEKHDLADAKVLADLKKRKLVKAVKVVDFEVQKGSEYQVELAVLETDLTAAMLADGMSTHSTCCGMLTFCSRLLEDRQLQALQLQCSSCMFERLITRYTDAQQALGSEQRAGNLHPLLKMREEFRLSFFQSVSED